MAHYSKIPLIRCLRITSGMHINLTLPWVIWLLHCWYTLSLSIEYVSFHKSVLFHTIHYLKQLVGHTTCLPQSMVLLFPIPLHCIRYIWLFVWTMMASEHSKICKQGTDGKRKQISLRITQKHDIIRRL